MVIYVVNSMVGDTLFRKLLLKLAKEAGKKLHVLGHILFKHIILFRVTLEYFKVVSRTDSELSSIQNSRYIRNPINILCETLASSDS